MTNLVVIDSAAIVDVVTGRAQSHWFREQVQGRDLVAPGHFHAEVLNTLGKLVRREEIEGDLATVAVGAVAGMPVVLKPVPGLLVGAWARRDQHSLPDALYVELAAQLDTVVVTTDRRLALATPLAVAPPED